MNPQAIHQQIAYRLDQLKELHRKMKLHSSSIPQMEIDDFLQQVKQLYEAALFLNQHNSLRTMEEMAMTVADKFRDSPDSDQSAEAAPEPEIIRSQPKPPPPAPVAVLEEPKLTGSSLSFGKPMAESSSPVQADKSGAIHSKSRNGNTELHDLFEDMPTLAGQFKDQETIGGRIATNNPLSKRVAENIQKKPVKDLKQAIGINEKFQFINQLFGGDAKSYHSAVDHLNKCESLTAATDYVNTALVPHYQWNPESPPVELFLDLIGRRFQA